ncbi:Similar to CCNT1: Cyclin-T1 (Equus caballus) [Cotesia congregata]|uniref:Similar to CCNT1: Cyclin-T1 (Equus caballus) n=1 Tax=Cotesia congregata TaxID=51543 RepID=A0A8J2HEB9_COTCN|nr:Similar to CCNT1: Cyclin-T1 (Equus caballus) [Cotesia congregata]
MATEEKWYFTKEQLANTPSRKCGIDADKELSYRQQAANFIQDMGQRLVVTQLCINTAIVYMHRFYVFHSLSQFHRNSIASAALFLAAKVEEQPRNEQGLSPDFILHGIEQIMSISERQSPSMHHPSLPNSPFDVEPRRVAAVDDGGPSFQSARPYPAEEDKKKPPSQPSTRPPTDYREYRDKKERERLEREKMSQNSGSLPQDSKHHHSHHHKPSVPGPLLNTPSASSTLTMSGASGTPISKHMVVPQKGAAAAHHNHHHHHHHNRPDLKLQQKHSNSTGPRDPNRDSSRQRISRDYQHQQQQQQQQQQQPPNYSQHQLSANNHIAAPKDSNSAPDIIDPVIPEISHVDKPSNNNHHSGSTRPVPFDKRSYDPRNKLIDHRKEEQKNSQYPNPPKYPEHIRSNDRLSRKLPELEQRSEEVRKLIEKPLPIPKPRAEIQKEEYIANMLKQSHNPNKYNQDSKLIHNSNRIFPHDLSKSQNLIKSHHQGQQLMHQGQQHQMSQIFKDKNGIQNPNLGIIDEKIDKRKHEELTQVPIIKHKSLFSPDKITPDINQRKSRQKTPPVLIKSIKQEEDLNTQLFSMSPELSLNLNIKKENQEQKIKSEDNLDKKRLPILSSGQPDSKEGLKLPTFETELMFNGLDIKPFKTETDLSPMKSAQGISALLQEPLAPMPSLLQTLSSDEGIFSQSGPLESSQNLQELPAVTASVPTGQKPLGSTQPNISQVSEEPFVSTVDISAFAAAPVISSVPIVQPAAQEAAVKKQEHHKSEKKKKKEKHKHKDKDKDKSKDKHKHKHKDKDKHRDKDKDKEGKDKKDGAEKRDKHEEAVTAAPIKITIPKDKLNLVDTPDSKKKSPSAGIKIKIPKERLKNKELPTAGHQGPLKIKIRTNTAASGQPEGYNVDNRKREREDSGGQPPAKKFQHVQGGQTGQTNAGQTGQPNQGQRGSDRQNGRHYTSNNKVRGDGNRIGQQLGRYPHSRLSNEHGFSKFVEQPIYQNPYFFTNFPPPIFNGQYFDPNFYFQYSQFNLYSQGNFSDNFEPLGIDTSEKHSTKDTKTSTSKLISQHQT